jgi:DNA-binding transcriptional LysR family regulator
MHAKFEISQLNILLSASEAGSLNAAAKLVNRSQAAVSQQIQAMEATCGQLLLTRSSQGVELTPAGKILATYARQILDLHASALTAVSEDQKHIDVEFGMPDDYASIILPALISLTRLEFPEIRLKFFCAPSPSLQNLMKKNKLNMALVSIKSNEVGRPNKLKGLSWVSANGKAPSSNETLPLAISQRDGLDGIAAIDALKGANRDFEIICEANSHSAIMSVVKTGAAVAVFADAALMEHERHMVVRSGMPALPSFHLELLKQSGEKIPPKFIERVEKLVNQLIS